MKLFFLFLISFHLFAGEFELEAKKLASDLKTTLMSNLSQKISKDGVVASISFCHENVKPLSKKAASHLASNFEFGRTSHKLRNEKNLPAAWIKNYLKEYSGTFKRDKKQEFIIFKADDEKMVYLEPLYVQAQCLVCHGEKISQEVKDKVLVLYPNDQATGFKLNEFRGFIWIKQKSLALNETK